MTEKRTIITYWLLIIIPTLIIGGVAFQLISHEQERISRSALSSLSDRATAISESIQMTLEDIESELTRSLAAIPGDALKETLISWAETNPLVRNVFIWKNGERVHLQYPVDTMESTKEERQFIKRYDALFSGRSPWSENSERFMGEEEKQPAVAGDSNRVSQKRKNDFLKRIGRLGKERRELLELAKVERMKEDYTNKPFQGTINGNEKDEVQIQSGWIPWFAENRLFIIGWVQTKKEGPLYGVELELMTILSRLVTKLPEINSGESSYLLTGGNGQVFHQSGTFPVNLKKKPDISIPLSDLLPHWKIVAYQNGKRLHADRGFIYLSSLLLAIFVAAIISGGILLTRQARRSLKDAMEKTSFVSSVSHELKTPLTSIRMYAELLQSGRVKTPEKTTHYLSVIVTESQRLTRLVNNILDFGRLEEGRKKYHLKDFNLYDLLYEIVDIHSIRAEKAGLKLEAELGLKKMPVCTDRDAIEQVVLNLIDNAIKYASTGKKIIVALDDSDPECFILTICDHGPGIPPDQREKIFEKFHRVDNSLVSNQPGSGLGLSIARRILRDLGGDLLYRPGEKCGSCFITKIRKKK